MGSDRITSGSGLANLEKRLNGVGGRCIVQSDPGRGTRVEMIVAMPEPASPVVASGRNGLGKIGWQHESLVDES
jgi:signal transduction histidine kinase